MPARRPRPSCHLAWRRLVNKPSGDFVMLSLSLMTERDCLLPLCCHSKSAHCTEAECWSCAFLGRNMNQALVYQAVDPACSRVGRATQTAGTFLAVLCLFFGAAFAATVPASLEKRIVYLFFVGLVPALGFYVSGHILRQMLGLSCKLCEIIAARCVRLLAPFANGLVNWAGASVLDALDRCSMKIARCLLTTGQCMQRLFRLGRKAYCLVHRWYWHIHKAIFDFSCLLIRNAARFVIRMQHSVGR